MGKESACNTGDTGLIPGSGRSPKKEMATHSSILTGKSHTKRSLVHWNPKGCKQSDTADDYILRAHPKLSIYCFISVPLVRKILCNQHSSKHREYSNKVRFMEFTVWFKENIYNK